MSLESIAVLQTTYPQPYVELYLSLLPLELLEYIIIKYLDNVKSLISFGIVNPHMIDAIKKKLLTVSCFGISIHNHLIDFQELPSLIHKLVVSENNTDLQSIRNIYGIEDLIRFCCDYNDIILASDKSLNNLKGLKFLQFLIKQMKYESLHKMVTENLFYNDLSIISSYIRNNCIDNHILYILTKKVFSRSFIVDIKKLSMKQRSEVLSCISVTVKYQYFIEYESIVCMALKHNYKQVLILLFENYVFNNKLHNKYDFVIQFIINHPELDKDIIKYYLELFVAKTDYMQLLSMMDMCISKSIKDNPNENPNENPNTYMDDLLNIILSLKDFKESFTKLLINHNNFSSIQFNYLINHCNIPFEYLMISKDFLLGKGIDTILRYFTIISKLNLDSIVDLECFSKSYDTILFYYNNNKNLNLELCNVMLSKILPENLILSLTMQTTDTLEINDKKSILLNLIEIFKKLFSIRNIIVECCGNIKSENYIKNKIIILTELFDYCLCNIDYILIMKIFIKVLFKKILWFENEIKDNELIETYQLKLNMNKIKSLIFDAMCPELENP
jgi:hypothetical protein